MNWSYISGYLDGEGCLLLNIMHDTRVKSQGATHGWNIMPNLTVQSMDYVALEAIKDFLEARNFKVYKLERRKKRGTQVGDSTRLSILSWKNIHRVFKYLMPHSIVKKQQYELFNSLYDLICNRKCGVHGQYLWSKPEFIKAMDIVDNINSLKGHYRNNKYTSLYFKQLWQGRV